MEPEIDAWRVVAGETPIDRSHLKDCSITTRRELCRAEALNIAKAFVKYLSAAPAKKFTPFDYSWLLRLHKEMFCDVWMWAGKPRQENLTMGVDWPLVPEQILSLTRDLPSWGQFGTSLLEQAARLHYRAVWIHPFMNGNGRWARLLANIWLRLNGSPIVLWPDENIDQESAIRSEYIKALKFADQGDFGPLLALHGRHLEQ